MIVLDFAHVLVILAAFFAVLYGAARGAGMGRLKRRPVDLGWQQFCDDVAAECARVEALKRAGR